MTNQEPRSVCIRLKQDWLGTPAGAVMSLNKKMADSLFRRDAAEIFQPDDPEMIREKLQARVEKKGGNGKLRKHH